MRQLKITTPDQVVFRLDAAGLATRAAAWLVDQALLLGLKVALVFSLVFAGSFALSLALPLLAFLDSAYFIYFEWKRAGQTPGKKSFGLRVVTVTGARLSFQDVLIRNILRIVDGLPLLMLTGGLTAFWEPLGRRLGDLAAGTLVVRERSGVFILPPADRARPNSFRENAACRRRILTRAGREDRDLALELMWRRDGLVAEAREALFGKVAGEFRRRFSLPEDDSLSDEQTVMDVAMLLAERDDG